jgi:penicillin amidase
MTRRLFGILILILSIALTILLSINIGSTPAIGKLLSPTHGFWANIEAQPEANEEIEIDAIHGKASVIYDENHIPHIFADNDEDLYYAQGYVMAKDRLWQMDFISYVASGRLTEIVGDKALPLDRYHRRIGLKRAAELSVPILMNDPMTKAPVEAFTNGVNAFIKNAKRGNLPIEYKILGYQPEEWKPIKCALLLKYMANDLTGTDNDIEYTNALKKLGREVFDQLYPDYPSILDPIIPLETAFNFKALKAPTPPIRVKDSSSVLALYKNPILSFLPQRGLGSNNWAVSGTKTASGKPILCNDPHLGLTFPSIWYEMQLNAPGINVYGVTLPGSPGIVIGYNDKIAWGVTNAGMDIRDWYTVKRDGATGKKYLIEGQYKDFEEVHEVYKVKGGKDFSEDIKWTEVGPIVYDQDFDTKKDKQDLAMSWLALNATNDLKTFHLLNRAKNHQDYLNALNQYWCPAQNFVYADVDNNIAIKQQGRFWIRYYEQGKFLQDLSAANVNQIKSYFIPNDQLPYVLNPERGFVSSANQIPAGKDYPYYVLGFQYENFRNRRINEFLTQTKEITIDDMKKLQYDNLSVLARDILPYMLSNTPIPNKLEYKEVIKQLAKWNYMTDYESNAASYFYKWWDEFEKIAWDELASTDDASFIYPEQYTTIDIMKQHPDFSLFDINATPHVETLKDILRISLDSTIAFFDQHPEEKEFRFYKNTSITHLLKFDAFSEKFIKIGGYANVVNATSSRWGASVRFIVDFKDGKTQGYGMYPGGQSGNPGSTAYKTFVEPWIDGKYFKHQFFGDKKEALKIVNN